MRKCPKCQSGNLHRSRTRSTWETLRRKITGKRPYRCYTCNWRWWEADLGAGSRNGDRDLSELRAAGPLTLDVAQERRGVSDSELGRVDVESAPLDRP